MEHLGMRTNSWHSQGVESSRHKVTTLNGRIGGVKVVVCPDIHLFATPRTTRVAGVGIDVPTIGDLHG